jgi:hypothetical protein
MVFWYRLNTVNGLRAWVHMVCRQELYRMHLSPRCSAPGVAPHQPALRLDLRPCTGLAPQDDACSPLGHDQVRASIPSRLSRPTGSSSHSCMTARGVLIDGRNRKEACRRAGVPPTRTTLPVGVDEVAFILEKNSARRHLAYSQRAITAATRINAIDATASAGVQVASGPSWLSWHLVCCTVWCRHG